MIEIAREAVTRIPSARRDLNAVTISIHDSQVSEITNIVHNMIREILALEDKIKDGSEVYQLNVQLFPFTKETQKEAEG